MNAKVVSNAMKTIGLIGGMSWESTKSYYELLNQGVKQRLGGLHSAKILLHSVDFAPIESMQQQGEWEEAGAFLANIALGLQDAKADMIALCTNTMHKVAPAIVNHLRIPFVHIAESTAKALKKDHKRHAILLGTRFTMQEDFYTSILTRHEIRTSIPCKQTCEKINDIIFNELCLGIYNESSKRYFLDVIHQLYSDDKSIDSVILGCTEIGLLIAQKDSFLPFFDTTILHVNDVLEHAFS